MLRENVLNTRMHSTRMRTVRCSSHLGGRCVCPGDGGCLPGGGVCAWGGMSWGCVPGGVSATHTHPHPCEQNHRRLWKHNLAATTLRTVNINWCWYFRRKRQTSGKGTTDSLTMTEIVVIGSTFNRQYSREHVDQSAVKFILNVSTAMRRLQSTKN